VSFKEKITYSLCLPWNLIIWPIWILMAKLWGENLHWEDGVLSFEFKEQSWPMRTWFSNWSGNAMGHATLYRPNPSARIKLHETVHVRQFEASMIKSFLLGCLFALLGHFYIGLLIWCCGYLIMGVGNYIHAWLRLENPKIIDIYRNTLHEQHAYAIDGSYGKRK